MYKLYKNQEILSGIKKMPCSPGECVLMNMDAVEHAFQNLTYNEIKVWIYFMINNNENIDLQNISRFTHIKDTRTIDEVISRLQNKGYLKEVNNKCQFLEYPEFPKEEH